MFKSLTSMLDSSSAKDSAVPLAWDAAVLGFGERAGAGEGTDVAVFPISLFSADRGARSAQGLQVSAPFRCFLGGESALVWSLPFISVALPRFNFRLQALEPDDEVELEL